MKYSAGTARITLLTRVRRLASFLLCLILTASVLTVSTAEDDAKVVRVGWYESSFNLKDNLGRRSGYAYEYQMKIAAYTGWRYEYVSGSWPELLQMLIRGEIDLMSDVSRTAEREALMLFPSLPMGEEDYYLFISSENTELSSGDDYSALNGKKVGVNRGSVQADYYRDWAERFGIETEVTEVTCSEEESLQMLQSGAIDAYVTVDSFSEKTVSRGYRPVPFCRIGSSDFYFAVSRDRPDLLSGLENALNRIQEENRNYNQEMSEKHLITAGANTFLDTEERNWLETHGKIRVGYQDSYLAFCAADPETGELTGALKDYLENAAARVINAHLEFEPRAYRTAAEAFEALQNGEVDCVFPANLTAGDSEPLGLVMTPPLMRSDIYAIVRQADRQKFSGREHVVVAVNKGNTNYESCLNEDFPGWRKVYYQTTPDCLKAVSRGIADCVLISSYRHSNLARECERERLAIVATGRELDYSFAVSVGQTELYSIMSKVAGLVPDSEVHSALSRYIAEDSRTTLQDIIRENAWGIVAAAVATALVILVLLLRSRRSEQKSEKLISATETDNLTGLYNRDYFLQYAARMRREHPDQPMDAVVLNIDRFHSVNALNGRNFGDQVLRMLGGEIHEATLESGGIASRFEADQFDIYCRPMENYQELYNRLQEKLEDAAPSVSIRMRMGVMPWRKEMEPVQMFDRARTACAMAKTNFKEHLIVYDQKMQEQELREQQLLNDVQRALNSYQFEVHYQPQFDIRSDPPKLVSAEALVRWRHPEHGMISPADFVPLLERNGKIGEVDRFVWSEAARQISRWKNRFGVMIPVSVNLSRVDVFDPALESVLEKLLAYNGLGQDALKLEVTESAYTENSDQIIRVVEELRRKGYIVEMDDFGSGYSSLHMLSAMPVDVLKMDREFIRRIGEGEKSSQLVALILGIAGSLKIPVVAEGVETEEQLKLLKDLGCPLVQGFYFSRPLPPEEFENRFLRTAQENS